MHLRTATTRDLPRLTQITTTSLIDDKTCDYMWPHLFEYPKDYVFWWQLRLERHLYDKKTVFLVVEIDHEEEETAVENTVEPASKIIAYGIWERTGGNKAAQERFKAKNTWLNMLDRTTAKVARWSVDQKYQRRDVDSARLEAVAAASQSVREKYFSDVTDWWSLELFVTDRNFRRRGAATRVVQWGTSQADKEGIFGGVDEASEMGATLYKSLGFQKLTTWVVQVPGDSDSLTYDVMRKEPQWEPRAE